MTAKEAIEAFGKSLSLSEFRSSAMYFDDVAKSIAGIATAADAASTAMTTYQTIYKNAESYQTAMDDYNYLNSLGTELTQSDVSNIANTLGVSAQVVIEQWSQVPTWLATYAS